MEENPPRVSQNTSERKQYVPPRVRVAIVEDMQKDVSQLSGACDCGENEIGRALVVLINPEITRASTESGLVG